jgi:hypothetical protein
MFIIPNLGFGVLNGLLFIIGIALIQTIYSYYNVNNSKNKNIVKIKNQEKQLSNYNLFYLYFTRYLHYSIGVFGLFFIFIFKQNKYLDILYCIFFFIIFYNIYWLGNECLLNYVEKNLLDNNYVYNSDYHNIPIYTVFFGKSDAFKIVYMVIINIFVIGISVVRHYYAPKYTFPIPIRM